MEIFQSINQKKKTIQMVGTLFDQCLKFCVTSYVGQRAGLVCTWPAPRLVSTIRHRQRGTVKRRNIVFRHTHARTRGNASSCILNEVYASMRRCTGLQRMKTFSLVKTLKTRSVSPDVNLKKRNDVSMGCLYKRYLGLSPNTQLVLIYMLLFFF